MNDPLTDKPRPNYARAVADAGRSIERGRAMRKIEVYAYGPAAQRHFEELPESMPWSERSEQSSSITVDWPDDARLPVVGDGFSVDWIIGHVRSASFHFEEGAWYFTIHVGPR